MQRVVQSPIAADNKYAFLSCANLILSKETSLDFKPGSTGNAETRRRDPAQIMMMNFCCSLLWPMPAAGLRVRTGRFQGAMEVRGEESSEAGLVPGLNLKELTRALGRLTDLSEMRRYYLLKAIIAVVIHDHKIIEKEYELAWALRLPLSLSYSK